MNNLKHIIFLSLFLLLYGNVSFACNCFPVEQLGVEDWNDADFIFDVRCLPNPFWQAELKNLTGLDAPVQKFLAEQPLCIDMFTDIRDFVQRWLPSFIDDNRNYMTIAIGCTGGKHRSVYLANELQKYFVKESILPQGKIQTQVRHREIVL